MLFKPTTIGTAVITAKVQQVGIPSSNLTFTVQVVNPVLTKDAHGSLVQRLLSFPLILAPVGGAGGAVAAVFLLRRRRRGTNTEEDFDNALE